MVGAGPMYQPSTPCGAHEPCTLNFSCTMTFVPGGANGVQLKSNAPLSCASAESSGFILNGQSRFK
eukprot:8348956-Ditylum_brightwellii.AAC.1